MSVQPAAAANDAAANDNKDTLTRIERPSPNDVLMGRGAPVSEHEGNSRLRQIVVERHAEYVAPHKKRQDKHNVALEIIETVRERGGRFLRKVEDNNNSNSSSNSIHDNDETTASADEDAKPSVWQLVDDEKEIIRKVKQLLRDMGPEARQRRAERHKERRKTPQKSDETKEDSAASASTSAAVGTSSAAMRIKEQEGIISSQANHPSSFLANAQHLSLMNTVDPSSQYASFLRSNALQPPIDSLSFSLPSLPSGYSSASAIPQSWQSGMDRLRAAPASLSQPTREELLAALQAQSGMAGVPDRLAPTFARLPNTSFLMTPTERAIPSDFSLYDPGLLAVNRPTLVDSLTANNLQSILRQRAGLGLQPPLPPQQHLAANSNSAISHDNSSSSSGGAGGGNTAMHHPVSLASLVNQGLIVEPPQGTPHAALDMLRQRQLMSSLNANSLQDLLRTLDSSRGSQRSDNSGRGPLGHHDPSLDRR